MSSSSPILRQCALHGPSTSPIPPSMGSHSAAAPQAFNVGRYFWPHIKPSTLHFIKTWNSLFGFCAAHWPTISMLDHVTLSLLFDGKFLASEEHIHDHHYYFCSEFRWWVGKWLEEALIFTTLISRILARVPKIRTLLALQVYAVVVPKLCHWLRWRNT